MSTAQIVSTCLAVAFIVVSVGALCWCWGYLRGLRQGVLAWAPKSSYEKIFGKYPKGAEKSYGDVIAEQVDFYREQFRQAVDFEHALSALSSGDDVNN